MGDRSRARATYSWWKEAGTSGSSSICCPLCLDVPRAEHGPTVRYFLRVRVPAAVNIYPQPASVLHCVDPDSDVTSFCTAIKVATCAVLLLRRLVHASVEGQEI